MITKVLRKYFLKFKIAVARRRRRMVSFRFNGKLLWINADDSALYHIENSVDKLALLVEKIPTDSRVILDIGANCGFFAALVLQRCPLATVICIEASKDLLPVIKKNCPDRAIILHCAVVETDGPVTFYVNESSQQTNSVIEDAVLPFVNGRIKSETVQGRALDSLMNELSIDKIDCIKIDIQGAEFEAFKGGELTLERSSRLMVESTWLCTDSIFGIQKVMDRYGFSGLEVVAPVLFGADLVLTKKL